MVIYYGAWNGALYVACEAVEAKAKDLETTINCLKETKPPGYEKTVEVLETCLDGHRDVITMLKRSEKTV